MKKILLLALPTLLLFSCKKNADVTIGGNIESNIEGNIDKSTAAYKYIKDLGYRDSEIKDIGKQYLVDGDILFDKNSNPDFSIFGRVHPEQYGSANYVGYNIQPNITIRVDPSMNVYLAEINGAIALWNNVANCRVKFTITGHPSDPANIVITNANLGTGVCGAAYFAMNGLPGALIRININQIAGYPFLQRQRTITHELGHTIGFRHTNWQGFETPAATDPGNGAYLDAMQILGTPTGNDVNSLMNGRECAIGATALSNFDILAVQFLYPQNPPVAGAVPVFRYFSRATTGNHFFTRDYNDLGNGSNNGYIFEGIGFFAFSAQVGGSVPVYRYYQSSSDDHFYTTNFNTLGNGALGYVYEGIRFYAYPAALNGSRPVFRYYNSGAVDHFYTKNQNEFVLGLGGYSLEQTAFYAY